MRTFDMTPLFRNSVGFDRMARMLDGMAADQAPAYPPYNIEKLSDDSYRISMAVAGFSDADLTVEVKENQLTIAGKVEKAETDDENRQYLHRGIAERAFERRFNLADHIKVGSANLANGLLHVDLVREVPETMKPRTIAINGNTKAITDKAA